MAIADHHAVDAFRPARAAARGTAVSVIPGVELTCPTGRSSVHVIGLFSPRRFDEQALVEALELGAAGLGDANGAVPYDVPEAVRRIQALDGLAIAAHAKSSKGLFEECRSHALNVISGSCRFDALEIGAARDPHAELRIPEGFKDVPLISGSDAHELDDFQSTSHPYGVGSRAFWVNGPRRSVGFIALEWALQATGYVSTTMAFPPRPTRRHVDTMLQLGDRFVRTVADDRTPRRRQDIVDGACELLNGDGGFLLVGVRRRFQGATRGADLELSLVELHDMVVDAIQPSPVIRLKRYRTVNGQIHELAFWPTENPSRRYEERPRADARLAAQADRAALEGLDAIDPRRMLRALDSRLDRGTLGVGDLVRLWPYRDWFGADRQLTNLVAESLVRRIIEDERTPRWLRLWAAELPRARFAYRSAYQELARRAVTVDHRDRLREALAEAVRNGTLQAAERRTVEQWFERTQADLDVEGPLFPPPPTDLDTAKAKAARVFGDDIETELETEAERAQAQYQAAMQQAYGAQAQTVLEVTGDIPAQALSDLLRGGTDRIVTGTGGGSGPLVVVPDRLSTLDASGLLQIWAQAGEPKDALLRPLIKRCIESGKHLPVLRFGARLERAEVEALIEELATVGAAQQRNLILDDLRLLLDPPDPADETDYVAVLRDALGASALDAQHLGQAANAVLVSADARNEARNASATVHAEILDLAEPENKQNLRRPAIVLAGALGEEVVLEWWATEPGHQVRLSLMESIGLLEPADEVDAALFEGLASRAGLVERAARALAVRGEPGYEALAERLPSGLTERGYAVRGVTPVARTNPDRARELGYRACEDGQGPALGAIRWMDRELYLNDARVANEP